MIGKRRTAQILTCLILAAAVSVVVLRKTNLRASVGEFAQRKIPSPQDAIYAMLDAARQGDVKKYLSSYAGPMQQSLQQAQSESPDFAKYLRESNAGIKGITVTEPQELSDREVKTRVEYIFQDRNEVQFFYIEKTPAGWKISRIDSAERIKTLVPYETPVQ